MTKRMLHALVLMLAIALQAGAVLKERNIDETLVVLAAELEGYQQDQRQTLQKALAMEQQIQADLDQYLEEANQIALMVYSQKQDYIFDITYACQQATNLYHRFHNNTIPFDTIRTQLELEIARYNGLKSILEEMHEDSLNVKQQNECHRCLGMAQDILAGLMKQKASVEKFHDTYDSVCQRLGELNTYAQKRYRNIQANIFTNRGSDYLTILQQFGTHLNSSAQAITEKYQSGDSMQSQWRGHIVWMVFAIMAVYGLVAMFLGQLIYRYIIPRTRLKESLAQKSHSAIMCFTTISFAVVVGILNLTVSHNFIHTATNLLMQYAWLLAAIQMSLLVRLKPAHIANGIRIYLPVLIMGFIIIVLRIIFLPGEVITLYLPPILAITTIIQWISIKRNNKVLPRSDLFYTWITLGVLVASVIFAWDGRVLMSVQLFIWWIMQLTCAQTITCLYDLLERYEKKRMDEGRTKQRTWLVDLINKCLLPITAIFSFLFSLYWSADVFNLSNWVMEIFKRDFVDVPDVISLSLLRISLVASLWYVARYVMNIVSVFIHHYFGSPKHNKNEKSAVVLSKNVAQIVIWGLYLITSMLILKIGNSWVLVITGGLSTGIGFAMKDTIENFFYGLSLMLGRLRIGDMIECDGVRGTVTDITYQSTTIKSTDGAEMAFLNSQLFNKNFKNMSRNKNHELVIIPVGVAYGTDVAHVRQKLIEAISPLDCYWDEKGIDVGFLEFGASSVDLKVVVWVDVFKKGSSVSRIKETIYNTLNRENIEIPFPQLDIHQR